MAKVLVADDLTFLEDLPVYSDRVAFLLHKEGNIVKESYREFKKVDKDKTCNSPHMVITDTKGYDDKITKYTIRAMDDVVIDYSGKGPAIETKLNQITCSDKDFYNRRSSDIGYKASTGEVMTTTTLDYHMGYEEVSRYHVPSFININAFRSIDSDPNHPLLDTSIDTLFFYDENKLISSTILLAREIRQRYRPNGDLYDFKKSNVKYGYDITGELIKIDAKTKVQFEGDRNDICPRLKVDDEGLYHVRYVSMAKPYDIHVEEIYELAEDAFVLKKIINNDINVTIDFKWEDYEEYYYSAKHTSSDGTTATVTGFINRPTSGDMFMYSTDKHGLAFSKLSYFSNTYIGDADGSCFLINGNIEDTEITTKDGNTVTYIYDYDPDTDTYLSQYRKENNSKDGVELANVKRTVLPNGNTIIESAIYADPMIKKDKNTILYTATEVTEDKVMVSQYKVLIVESEK